MQRTPCRLLSLRWLCLIGILSAILSAPVLQAQTKSEQTGGTPSEPSADWTSELDETVTTFCRKNQVPGLSLAVLHHGDPLLARGYGYASLEHQVKVTPETRFRTASIAKPITATLLMTLVADGRLDLDRPVQDYVAAYPEKRWPIQVRQVMGHLGGIRHYKSAAEASSTRHFSSLDQALETFAQDPLEYEPGTEYRYSSFGYNLLGSVAEGAGGKDFVTLLQERILQPSGMSSTVPDDVFAIVPHRSAGYRRADQRWLNQLGSHHGMQVGQVYNSTLHDTSMKIPGGGLLSTPTDLVRFAEALLNDQLIPSTRRQEMWTGQTTTAGKATGYGLGWRVGRQNDRPALWHTGGQSGTSTVLVIYPESQTAIAVMCNLQSTNVTSLANQVFALQQESETPTGK